MRRKNYEKSIGVFDMKKKKKTIIKVRDWIAIHAHFRKIWIKRNDKRVIPRNKKNKISEE